MNNVPRFKFVKSICNECLKPIKTKKQKLNPRIEVRKYSHRNFYTAVFPRKCPSCDQYVDRNYWFCRPATEDEYKIYRSSKIVLTKTT